MHNSAKIEISAMALKCMTYDQFDALRENVLADGKWEQQNTAQIVWVPEGDKGYVGVTVGGMFIGIEQNGYTHS